MWSQRCFSIWTCSRRLLILSLYPKKKIHDEHPCLYPLLVKFWCCSPSIWFQKYFSVTSSGSLNFKARPARCLTPRRDATSTKCCTILHIPLLSLSTIGICNSIHTVLYRILCNCWSTAWWNKLNFLWKIYFRAVMRFRRILHFRQFCDSF